MLTITDDQLAAINRDHMIDRIHALLTEQSPDPAVQALLASAARCRAFWTSHYPAVAADDRSEYGVAVRLAYLLAAQAHGFEPRLAFVDGNDAEIAMRSQMEERRVLAFTAFDV